MKKLARTLSVFILAALLGLPALSAAEMQVAVIRDRVIGDSITAAYTEESGTEQSVMVFIKDIDHGAVERGLPETQPAALTLSSAAEEYENQAEIEAVQADIMARRAASREAYLAQNTAFAEKYLDGKVEYISKYSPVIIASLDSVETNQLALNGAVESIELYDMELAEEEPLAAPLAETASTTAGIDYLGMINADDVHENGYTGQGIKIGILETELPFYTERDALGLTANHCYNIATADASVNYLYAGHASFVAYTAKSVAPDAQLYAAHATSGYIPAIEWLIDQGVNVINISMSISYEDENGNAVTNIYDSNTAWFDHIALNHLVSIVFSVGNNGVSAPGEVFVGNLSYNAIVVGAVDVNGAIYSKSSYTHITFAEGSRPDISAPGVNIQPEGMSYSVDGTSLAAPMVTGAVALLLQQKPNLTHYPDTIKAILAANVSTSFNRYVTWPLNSTNGYERYGAGILDCLNVYNAMLSTQYNNDGGFNANTSGARESFTIDLEAGKPVRIVVVALRDAIYNHSTWLSIEAAFTMHKQQVVIWGISKY